MRVQFLKDQWAEGALNTPEKSQQALGGVTVMGQFLEILSNDGLELVNGVLSDE